MEISRWDLRKALRFVTDNYYETVKDTDANGLTIKEYFDISWYLIEENFILRTGGDLFIIQYNNEKNTTLKFLRYFLVFINENNLQFRITYEFGTTKIIIFTEFIDENILLEIMSLIFWESNSLLTDCLSQIKGEN